jgi:hypothetical protein
LIDWLKIARKECKFPNASKKAEAKMIPIENQAEKI